MDEYIAKHAHNFNLSWGIKTNTVVDKRGWEMLRVSERTEKTERIAAVKQRLKDAGLELTAENLHALWLESAPKKQPCNKLFKDLTSHQKAKDEIYMFFIRLSEYL